MKGQRCAPAVDAAGCGWRLRDVIAESVIAGC